MSATSEAQGRNKRESYMSDMDGEERRNNREEKD